KARPERSRPQPKRPYRVAVGGPLWCSAVRSRSPAAHVRSGTASAVELWLREGLLLRASSLSPGLGRRRGAVDRQSGRKAECGKQLEVTKNGQHSDCVVPECEQLDRVSLPFGFVPAPCVQGKSRLPVRSDADEAERPVGR